MTGPPDFAATATMLTLLILGVLVRWSGACRHSAMRISTQADSGLERDDIMTTVMAHDIKCAAPGYHLEDMRKIMRYEFTLRSINSGNFKLLAETLRKHEKIAGFSVIPTGEQRVHTSIAD